MSSLEKFKQLISQEVDKAKDISKAVSSEKREEVLLPEGYGLGRIVGYTDLGKQPQEYKGVKKDPIEEFRLVIAFTSKNYTNSDGTPYMYYSFPIKLTNNDQSRCQQYFRALNNPKNEDIKHFAQFLGRGYAFKVIHQTSAKGKVYHYVDLSRTLTEDPVSGQSYDDLIPQLDDDFYSCFLWNNPDLEEWNKLFIEGENEDGSSRNFIQNRILNSLNFNGSKLEQLIKSVGSQKEEDKKIEKEIESKINDCNLDDNIDFTTEVEELFLNN